MTYHRFSNITKVAFKPVSILLWIFLSTVIGCGTKEQSAPEGDTKQDDKTLKTESSDLKSTKETPKVRQSQRSQEKGAKDRPEERARSRKWAEEDRYMRLVLEKIELNDEQLSSFSDINWEHFIALETLKNERPSSDEALLEMLKTGIFSSSAFEAEEKHDLAIQSLQKKQYQERMSLLHKVLDEKQRKDLIALVEVDEKKQYAKEDKQTPADKAAPSALGCGIIANRLFSITIDDKDLNRKERKKLAALQEELNKDNPDPEQVKDLQQAERIFDMAVRKAFVRDSFNAALLNRPVNPYNEPSYIAACRLKAMESLLKLLTPESRKTAAEKLIQRKERRGILIPQTKDAGV